MSMSCKPSRPCDFILSERGRYGRILTGVVISLDALGNIDHGGASWMEGTTYFSIVIAE